MGPLAARTSPKLPAHAAWFGSPFRGRYPTRDGKLGGGDQELQGMKVS